MSESSEAGDLRRNRAFNQSDFMFWVDYSSGVRVSIEYAYLFPAIEKRELQVKYN